MTLSSLNILPSPFPGLRPFQTEETHLFFGREGQIDEVLSKIDKHRFVAILGTSGSGKSSFMYCGMIPSLHGGFMSNAGADWRVIVSRPGLSPIDNLSQAITQSELPDAEEEEFRVGLTADSQGVEHTEAEKHKPKVTMKLSLIAFNL